MGGSTDSLKKIMAMRTFKVRSDEIIIDAATEEPKRCFVMRGQVPGYCNRDCTYYNETEKQAGMVLCRCLEKVMGFVTRV